MVVLLLFYVSFNLCSLYSLGGHGLKYGRASMLLSNFCEGLALHQKLRALTNQILCRKN